MHENQQYSIFHKNEKQGRTGRCHKKSWPHINLQHRFPLANRSEGLKNSIPNVTVGFYDSSNVIRPMLCSIAAEFMLLHSLPQGLPIRTRVVEYIK
jgi:hypothetical protein